MCFNILAHNKVNKTSLSDSCTSTMDSAAHQTLTDFFFVLLSHTPDMNKHLLEKAQYSSV